jgi:hypothetical protein
VFLDLKKCHDKINIEPAAAWGADPVCSVHIDFRMHPDPAG